MGVGMRWRFSLVFQTSQGLGTWGPAALHSAGVGTTEAIIMPTYLGHLEASQFWKEFLIPLNCLCGFL